MLKKLSPLLVLFLIALSVWYFLYSAKPGYDESAEIAEEHFSTSRAFEHVEQMSKAPHFVGSASHSRVRNYIVNELQEMGLEVQTQEGYSLNKYGDLSFPRNILARIPGSGEGKSILLMSHYDSAVHSSFGASDAASGVATILESIRAFLSKNEAVENEIILLITDAEEVGLLGAELFIKKHPWAKETGLAFNFESRGSGGNSFMLLETNGGNSKLIEHFKNAEPQFPVTNSLAYSVYKMLPNDTDLTVLREQGNINGFNFAFIDDHFDYHTANDTPANLDKETLAHQGSYLMPLLEYFKDVDISNLNTKEDLLYFNIPPGQLITYPFSWIYPMLIIAILIFTLLLFYGFYKKHLKLPAIFKGAIPYLLSLFGSAVLVYFLWKFCLIIYPGYLEMEHGFTYNGYYYIAAAIFLTLSICFLMYHIFKSEVAKAEYFIFPLFFWILVCTLAAFYLKGASYFIIPLFFGLLQLWMMMRTKVPNLFLIFLLSLPSLVILLPFVLSFPVALGLKILFVTAILVVFLFALFLPVFSYFKLKNGMALLCFLIFNMLFIVAHFKSDFTEERQKPNSLVYLYDADKKAAFWYSYDNIKDAWTSPYFTGDIEVTFEKENFSSKYGSNFTMQSPAPTIELKEPGIIVEKLTTGDSLNEQNEYSIKIAPNRRVNRMELFVDRNVNFEEFRVNNIEADSVYLGVNPFHIFKKRWENRLLTYYAANQDTLRLTFSLKGEEFPQFTLYEASNDLLENEELKVSQREEDMIPRPFVLNDAVIIKRTIQLKE